MATLAYGWKSRGRDEDAVDLKREEARIPGERLGFDHLETANLAQTLNDQLAETELDEGSTSNGLEGILPLTADCRIHDHADQVD
jgi:hypothetical protein